MKRKEDIIVMDYRRRGHPSNTRKKLEAAAKRAKPNPRPAKCVIMEATDLEAMRARIMELEAEIARQQTEINDLKKGMRGLSFAQNLYHPPR